MANQEKDRDGQRGGGQKKDQQQGSPKRIDRNQQSGGADAGKPDNSGLTRGGIPEDLRKKTYSN